MTSQQILMTGLAGAGFILLALLLTYFISLQRRRLQAVAAGQNPATNVAARFSTPSPLPAHERVGWDPHQHGRLPAISNWRWPLLLLIALGIGVWAEFSLLELLRENWNADIRVPLVGLLVAGAIFVLVCRKVEGPSLATRFKAIVPVRLAPRPALWLTNLCLGIIVLSSIDRDLPPWSGYLFLGLWIVNILLFCWNILQVAHVSLPGRDDIREWWHSHRLEVLLVSVIGLAALSIRIIGLESYPAPFTNDEGEVGREIARILSGERSSFFLTDGWGGIPGVTFLPGAISVKLFDDTPLAIRLSSALQGTLAVVFMYLLAREAFGRPVGFLAACLLAALPWHVHFSRLGLPYIADSFFSAGILWLTYRALRHGGYTNYLLAGLMSGFAIYTYLGGLVLIAMPFAVLVYACLRQGNYLKTHFQHLLIFVLAFLVVASPMIVSFSYHSNEFIDRLNSEALLANHQLEDLAASIAMQPLDYMITQLQSSTMVFIARPATAQFFDSPKPYIEWWSAIFLILGLAYSLWRIKEVRYMLLTGWFWAPVIISGALTTFPPSNQRMLAAAPALALLVALGLWKLAHSIRVMTRLPANLFMALCMLVIIFTAWQDIQFYFVGQYRIEHQAQAGGNEFSYRAGTGEHGICFAAIPCGPDDLSAAQQLPGTGWLNVPYTTCEDSAHYGYILPAVSITS
jgi:hypothetical protein